MSEIYKILKETINSRSRNEHPYPILEDNDFCILEGDKKSCFFEVSLVYENYPIYYRKMAIKDLSQENLDAVRTHCAKELIKYLVMTRIPILQKSVDSFNGKQ